MNNKKRMECLLTIKYIDEENHSLDLRSLRYSGHGTLENIFDDLKVVVNELKSHSKNNYDDIMLTYDNFIMRLCDRFDNYSHNIKEGNDWINYYVDIVFEDTIIIMKAYHKDLYNKNIIAYENRYVTSLKNEGNCIDDFIVRGVQPQIDNITDLVDQIKSRLPERQVTVEYHRTMCYERDFTQISLIKKMAEKIVQNCNTQLERISEFYTR